MGDAQESASNAAAAEGDEFEVEDILRYRRNADGEEYFLVKWIGFPISEATWEPLRHMNENCREIVAKARALFAWRKPTHQGAGPTPSVAPELSEAPQQPLVQIVEEVDDESDAPRDGELQEELQDALRDSPGAGAGSDDNDVAAEQPPTPSVKRKASELSLQNQQPKKKHQSSAGGSPEDAVHPALNSKVLDIKCICGANEKSAVPASERDKYILCKICSCALHPGCVEDALNTAIPPDFVCPPCRLERVDDFHPPVGQGLLRHSYASASSTFSLDFAAQANLWKKQQWNVHLRAVALRSAELGGPAWPHKVTGKLNNRQCVAIDPPKHLHIRREQCYNLTPLLKQGVNSLEMRFTPKPDRPREEPEESYCVGVVVTRPRSVASIISRIRTRSTETVSTGRQRIERLLAQINWKEQGEEECMVTGNFGRSLRPICPVSLCPIEEAAIGRGCVHVQVFDLQAYIAVNQRMRSLDKRWTCPVCSVHLRPDDLILDPFCQGILDTMRGEEDLVEAIVFNEDCSWTTVSAVKEDKDKPGAGVDEAAAENARAEMIDLSDSE